MYFLIFCRPKKLKVKMKGKCCDWVRWQEVDLIWCFANCLHPLLSACPLHPTVPDKKRQLVFKNKEHNLANHVIFCVGTNFLSWIILPFPCLSRKWIAEIQFLKGKMQTSESTSVTLGSGFLWKQKIFIFLILLRLRLSISKSYECFWNGYCHKPNSTDATHTDSLTD